MQPSVGIVFPDRGYYRYLYGNRQFGQYRNVFVHGDDFRLCPSGRIQSVNNPVVEFANRRLSILL